MSAPLRRPASSTDPSNRPSMAESPGPNGATSRSVKSPTSPTNGLQRSPSGRVSPMSARAAARKPLRSNLSVSSVPKLTNEPADEDARAENAALIGELKEQLQKAEMASEQYFKQLGVLQMRLDEAISEQVKLEDQSHEKDTKIEALNTEIREHARRMRECGQVYEMERNAMFQDKELQASREEELQIMVQRLKESLAQKEIRMNIENDKNVSRSSSFRNRSSPDTDNGQFAPSSQLERSPSHSNAKLLLQKDKLIESLRLELAESQIKLVEMENRGGGRQQELERELLEARMANARLMEDNESYQLLLSEKTLNGDFTKGDFMHDAAPEIKRSISTPGSLAEELESVGEGEVMTTEDTRKLEAEIKTLKDQNKALTLYIERIIGRLLQHEGFESILDKNDSPPSSNSGQAKTDKELPPTPLDKDEQQTTLLQRARSVMSGQTNRAKSKPRPANLVPQPLVIAPTPHENPETAPSIPLQSTRAAHRRTRSELVTDGAAPTVVGQMYRGPPGGRTPSGGPGISPTAIGPGHRQSSIFSGTSYISGMSAGGRAPSQSSQPDRKRLSSSDSASSDPNAEVNSTGANSTPPSRTSAGLTNYTGAVMTQNKLRPLRLVQENQELESGHQGGFKTAEEEEVARKKANRGSWIPWFNRPREEEAIKT